MFQTWDVFFRQICEVAVWLGVSDLVGVFQTDVRSGGVAGCFRAGVCFSDRCAKWRFGWVFQSWGVFFRQMCEVAVWLGVSELGCVF